MKKLITIIDIAVTVELMACTAWVTAPDVSANGKLFIHKTRDWGAGKEIPVTLRHETAPDGKYKALAFSPYMLFNGTVKKNMKTDGSLCSYQDNVK